MKKIVLFSFALAVSLSLSAQTVIFHFIVNMDSAQLGANNSVCMRTIDSATDNVEILGNYLDSWVSSAGNYFCTDSIVQDPIVDFIHTPGSFIYSKTDTVTDSAYSNFTDRGWGGPGGFFVRSRINHSWDNAEVGELEITNRNIPVPAGTSEVTVQWIFGDTAQSSVVLVYKMVTGIKNIATNISGLAPNPATGKTTLTYATSATCNVQILIINLLGQKIRTILNTQQMPGVHLQPVNVSGLANGVYFLNIDVNGSTLARKFSVVN